ncbi:uncharacterized protein LOC131307046 [Rhododendron vialii]|uniref:uncharacterized protein LOC131307046 n=1 Tax=Rhododendron vialii TaxID=182163 RepID=UPI00265E8981|nr:uncharacterized protein LOC131307046 [Rhododendron vialii]
MGAWRQDVNNLVGLVREEEVQSVLVFGGFSARSAKLKYYMVIEGGPFEGASVNLLPYSVYLKLGLSDLKATPVTLQLADRSVRIPKGVVEDVLIQVGEFLFPVDFIVLDTCPIPEVFEKTPIILGRPFLATSSAVMNCKTGQVQLSFGDLKMEVNVFNVDSRVEDDEEIYEVSLIDTLVQEHVDSVLYKDPLEITLTAEEASFLDSPEVGSLMEMLAVEDVCGAAWNPVLEPLGAPLPTAFPSSVQPPKPELKPLPDTLKYAFLKGDDTFPVVISSSLEVDQEAKLLTMLRKHVGAIGWTIADLQGISPTVCTHRIFLDEDVKPTRQPQRRLNPNMKEVVRAEVLKLLDAGIIYPIAHSEWVSPVQVVPKKAGVTVVRNGEGELVPTRVQTGWRVCIDYRKLNASTRKDHFPLPFIDQILERVAGRAFYCFLDGYSGYNQIEVAMEDQEKTTFTCPYGTFAYRRMPFGLCNAPGTFSRCMMGIFSDMVEKIVEVFMDDFSVFGDSFDECLENLGKVLQRCEEKQLVLNWEKCHFMVTQGIVLGHIVSSKGIEVDKAKIDLIANLPTPKSVKDIRSFLGHAGFYRRFIKGFSAISWPLCHLLSKDTPFVWSEACKEAFQTLKRSLTTPPIVQPPDWSLPFELMCDASDYAVGAVLGQRRGKDPCVVYYASKTLNEAQMNYTTTEKELLAVVFALDKSFEALMNKYGISHKLRSRWDGPYVVHKVYPNGSVDVCDPKNDNISKVNGQRLKSFLEYVEICEPDEIAISTCWLLVLRIVGQYLNMKLHVFGGFSARSAKLKYYMVIEGGPFTTLSLDLDMKHVIPLLFTFRGTNFSTSEPEALEYPNLKSNLKTLPRRKRLTRRQSLSSRGSADAEGGGKFYFYDGGGSFGWGSGARGGQFSSLIRQILHHELTPLLIRDLRGPNGAMTESGEVLSKPRRRILPTGSIAVQKVHKPASIKTYRMISYLTSPTLAYFVYPFIMGQLDINISTVETRLSLEKINFDWETIVVLSILFVLHLIVNTANVESDYHVDLEMIPHLDYTVKLEITKARKIIGRRV